VLTSHRVLAAPAVLYLKEDPGNQDILARIWSYNIKSKKLDILARHDPALYDPSLKVSHLIPVYLQQNLGQHASWRPPPPWSVCLRQSMHIPGLQTCP
jgi:hypothetical protein